MTAEMKRAPSASQFASKLEDGIEDKELEGQATTAEAGLWNPIRIRFKPQRHLLEPPQPPPTDHKVEEEQAAQAAAQAAGYEGRRMRRFLQRRTVDYMGSWIRYRDKRLYGRSTARNDYWLKPSPHFVIDVSDKLLCRRCGPSISSDYAIRIYTSSCSHLRLVVQLHRPPLPT